MEQDKHMKGFEREERYNEAFQFLTMQCPNIHKRNVLSQILDIIDPNITNGLFKSKPCVRKLRYIDEPYRSFEKGAIYTSIDFNGGTYTIEGSDRFIGSAYFEIID